MRVTSRAAVPWFAVAGVFLVNALLSAVVGASVLAVGQVATGVLAAVAGVGAVVRARRRPGVPTSR